MNKYGWALTLAVLSCEAVCASAGTEIAANWNCKPKKAVCKPIPECYPEWPFNFEVGGDYTYMTLRPDGNPSFHGSLGGLQGIFEYRPKDHFYGAATLAWKQGKVRGSGSTRSILFIDTQERLGYSIGTENNRAMVTLFSGLGYRYVGQHLKPSTGRSLNFNYSEIYVPVGLIAYGNLTPSFTFGAAGTWMPQVFPTVSIVPLKGSRWDLTRKIGNYFVELIFDFAVTEDKQFHIILNPFYERWKDGHTTAKTTSGVVLGIPGNTYNFWGLDLNFAYYF